MTRLITLAFLSLFTLNAHSAIGKQQYPDQWWDEFPEDQAKSWEILPQDARPPKGQTPREVILSKRNELGILSNFAHTPFTYKGVKYESLEGFWQMMKYPEDKNDPRFTEPGISWQFTREEVSKMVGFDAKDAGKLASKNMKAMGINWVSFEGKKLTYKTPDKAEHYKIIREATVEKVRQNAKVKRILLATDGLKLRPDHKTSSNPPPAWKYYEILTEIREDLLKKP